MTVVWILLATTAGCVINALVIGAATTRPMIGVLWYASGAVLDVVVAALAAAGGVPWWLVAWMGVLAVVNAWMARDYWNRRKRKRAAALAGAKSRARIAALVARARQAARPRRALRPLPGGAP
jgi:hypothetical protein